MTSLSDRPGYERVSSSVWKQRENYCSYLIQRAYQFHHNDKFQQHAEDLPPEFAQYARQQQQQQQQYQQQQQPFSGYQQQQQPPQS